MADIKYIISADGKKASKSIGQVDKSIDGMKKQAKKAKSPLSGMFKQIALGVGSVLALRKAIRTMTKFMGDAIEKAKIQEQAETELAAALETTGRNVGHLLPKLKAHASAIQDVTIYGDEATLSAMALLAQMTDLGEVGLKRATEASVGLATVMKTDLKSASTLLAKALGGNIGALSRYGIQVDKNLTTEEKRASILDQLSVMYERAQKETDTFTGAQEQLKNTYGDLKEAIGFNIIQSDEMVGTLKDTKEWIEKNQESISLYFSALVEGATVAVKALAKVAKGIASLADLVGVSDKEWKSYISTQQQANGIIQEGINVQKFRRTAINEEIITVQEWGKLWQKHGRDFSAVMKAIAEGDEGEDLKNLLVDLQDETEAAKKEAEEAADTLKKNFAPALSDTTKKTKSLKDELNLTFRSDLAKQIEDKRKALELYGDKLPEYEVKRLKDEINELNEKLGLVAETAIPAGRNLRTAFEGEAIPAARDLNLVLEEVPDKMDDIVFATEETTGNVTSLWDEMTDGLKTKWGSMFGDFLSGAKSFEKDYGDIWGALKEQFFDIVGQMLAKFTTGFLDKIVGKAADAGAGLLDNLFGGGGGAGGGGGKGGGGLLGNLLGGAGGAGGIWTGIGAAAGNLLGSLITGNKQKGAIDATNRELHNIWTEARHIYQDQAHILTGMDTIKWPIVEMRDILKGGASVSPGQAAGDMESLGGMKQDMRALTVRSRIRNKTLSDIRDLLSGRERITLRPTVDVSRGGAGVGVNTAAEYKKTQRIMEKMVSRLDEIVQATKVGEPVEMPIAVTVEMDGREIAKGISPHAFKLSERARWKLHVKGLVGA